MYKNIFSDPEFWFLITINCILAYLYKVGQIAVFTIVWIYYVQSLLIGVQYFVRLLSLKNTGVADVKINASSPRKMAFFFLLH